MSAMLDSGPLSRRAWLSQIGGGVGALGLATVLHDAGLLAASATATGIAHNPLAPKAPHFPPRAKHLIFLFMNGGPSHLDTFDPKPALHRYAGQPIPDSYKNKRITRREGRLLPSPFMHRPRGQSAIDVSELFPHVAAMIDDVCVIRSMHTDTPSHEPGLLFMNSGNMQPIRPSMGSWLTYPAGLHRPLPGEADSRAAVVEQQFFAGGVPRDAHR
jgi:hypothetical protein